MFLACLTFHRKKIRLRHLHTWTSSGSARDILNFYFLEKGLGIVSPSHFMYGFSTKCSPCHILLTDQISLCD